jgi:polysaccharide pyruvyl transferase WcaK-like protein
MDYNKKSNSVKHFSYFVNIAKFLRRKIFILFIGMGPFTTKAQINQVRKSLNKCDYISFRDEKSAKYYSKLNNLISIDPVFSLKNTKKRNYRRIINISIGLINPRIFSQDDISYNNYINNITNLIVCLRKEGFKISLFSTELSDYAVINDIKSTTTDFDVIYIESESQLLKFYKNDTDFLIASRMHSLIIAFTQSIPIYGIVWHEKVLSFFNLIENQNYTEIGELGNGINKIFSSIYFFNSSENYRYYLSKTQLIIKNFNNKFKLGIKMIKKILT